MKTSSPSAFVTLLVVASTCLLVWPRGAAASEVAPILSACDGKRGCPSRILLNRERGLDTLSFRGLVALPDGFVPAEHALEVTLAHAGGEIFHATLAPGELRRTKRRWLHRDGAARSRGGLSRVELRALRGGGWRVSLIGHGDMAAATLAEMGLELTIGGHVFLVVTAWDEREFGWLLHLENDATATPTPAPTASPSPAPTCQSAMVTIATSYEPQVAPDFVAGVTTTLDYPGGLLDIPGVGNAASVLARVTNVSGTNGLFSAGDQDASGDGFDDRISIGLISTAAAIAPGAFARVVFDCVAGAPRPTIADFACTPDVSSLFGTTLEASCAVVDLQVSPP